MNYGAGVARKAMVAVLLMAVGAQAVLCTRMGHTAEAKACVLSPSHGGLAFPVEKIEPQWVCQLQAVVDHYAIVNTVGPIRVALPDSLYQYLLDHPVLAVGLINRLNLGSYISESRGPDRFWGDDGGGSRGVVQLVYKDPASRIYYLEGSHNGRLMPHLTGTAVVFLRMTKVKDSDGRDAMDSTVVSYTKLDNRVLSGLVSLLRPLVGGVVAGKLRKGVDTVDRLGMIMRQHPERVVSAAMASPAFTDRDVTFLKEAFLGQQRAEDGYPRHSVLP